MPGPRVSKDLLESNGFAYGAGPNWYYKSSEYPHIHLQAPGAKDGSAEVTFISISLEAKGQNLAACDPNKYGDFKFNLSTPKIDWGNQEQERVFKQVLRNIKVALV